MSFKCFYHLTVALLRLTFFFSVDETIPLSFTAECNLLYSEQWIVNCYQQHSLKRFAVCKYLYRWIACENKIGTLVSWFHNSFKHLWDHNPLGHSAHWVCSSILIYVSLSTTFSCLLPVTFVTLTNRKTNNLCSPKIPSGLVSPPSV